MKKERFANVFNIHVHFDKGPKCFVGFELSPHESEPGTRRYNVSVGAVNRLLKLCRNKGWTLHSSISPATAHYHIWR